jgi:hypothetical protein
MPLFPEYFFRTQYAKNMGKKRAQNGKKLRCVLEDAEQGISGIPAFIKSQASPGRG